MTDQLIIITPELRPGAGGLADHTRHLLEKWDQLPQTRVLVARPDLSEPMPSGVELKQLGHDSAAILGQLPARGGKVFLQYSAYGFDRYGFPRQLLRALVDWKRRAQGRLVVMFHEIWAFWPIANKNYLLQRLHRRAIKRLLGVCDIAFTSTSNQADHLRRLSAVPIAVLPVGSNIRRSEIKPAEPKPGWAALFGLQETRLRALQTMRDSLRSLAAAQCLTKVISLGGGRDEQSARREHEFLLELKLEEGFEQVGVGSEEKISEILSSVSFGIFGQNELSYGKSGSFMAYASHGLNVLAEFADPAKPPPACYLVAPNELIGGISTDELNRRAKCLQTWQKQTCSWDVIAKALAEALEIDAMGPRLTV